MSTENTLNVPSWHGEDYESDWGFLDVEGKVVLDIGADYGSTAAFFLNKGATRVICVESYLPDYEALEVLAKSDKRIEAYHKHIASGLDFETFLAFQPDVVKIDVEGAEAHLLNVRPCVLRRVSQFGIEIHNLANSIQCGNPRPPAYEGINDLQPYFERFFTTKVGGYTIEPIYQNKWVLNVKRN
jgi:hypothetical protein